MSSAEVNICKSLVGWAFSALRDLLGGRRSLRLEFSFFPRHRRNNGSWCLCCISSPQVFSHLDGHCQVHYVLIVKVKVRRMLGSRVSTLRRPQMSTECSSSEQGKLPALAADVQWRARGAHCRWFCQFPEKVPECCSYMLSVFRVTLS